MRQVAASGYVAGIHLAAIVGTIVGILGALVASRVIPSGVTDSGSGEAVLMHGV